MRAEAQAREWVPACLICFYCCGSIGSNERHLGCSVHQRIKTPVLNAHIPFKLLCSTYARAQLSSILLDSNLHTTNSWSSSPETMAFPFIIVLIIAVALIGLGSALVYGNLRRQRRIRALRAEAHAAGSGAMGRGVV